MNKKLISVIIIGTLTSLVLPTKSVYADTTSKSGGKSITVNYNNQTVITDVTKPGNPEWQVVIPSGINFAENVKSVKTELSITKSNGQPLAATDTSSVDISVTSANEYKLKMLENSNESTIDYTLSYGEKTMSKTITQIGTLNKTNAKIEGLASLVDTSAATLIGNHSDTLTFSVATTPTTT